MALVAGNSLDSKNFFSEGKAIAQGSSFDLTIGRIFDHEGKEIDGIFTLKPGHMVQVVSAEVFNLNDRTTGHVTYKTTLTKKGIWALTVGIVDPGWTGPVSTTLLNFSKVDHGIAAGDAFLRVSFFEHDPVSSDKLRSAPGNYLKDIQKTAASMFPQTFLDNEKISRSAGELVLERIRKEALIWVAAVALIFTVIQVVLNSSKGTQLMGDAPKMEAPKAEIDALRKEIATLQTRVTRWEEQERLAPPAIGASPAPQTPNSPAPAAQSPLNQQGTEIRRPEGKK
jgi:deoxycytidine triphosphate deaminase